MNWEVDELLWQQETIFFSIYEYYIEVCLIELFKWVFTYRIYFFQDSTVIDQALNMRDPEILNLLVWFEDVDDGSLHRLIQRGKQLVKNILHISSNNLIWTVFK